MYVGSPIPRVFHIHTFQEQQKDRKARRALNVVVLNNELKEISLNIHFTETCQVRVFDAPINSM